MQFHHPFRDEMKEEAAQFNDISGGFEVSRYQLFQGYALPESFLHIPAVWESVSHLQSRT